MRSPHTPSSHSQDHRSCPNALHPPEDREGPTAPRETGPMATPGPDRPWRPTVWSPREAAGGGRYFCYDQKCPALWNLHPVPAEAGVTRSEWATVLNGLDPLGGAGQAGRKMPAAGPQAGRLGRRSSLPAVHPGTEPRPRSPTDPPRDKGRTDPRGPREPRGPARLPQTVLPSTVL